MPYHANRSGEGGIEVVYTIKLIKYDNGLWLARLITAQNDGEYGRPNGNPSAAIESALIDNKIITERTGDK